MASASDVWFLTAVYKGHVNLTSLNADSIQDAAGQAEEQMWELVGRQIPLCITEMKDVEGDAVDGYTFIGELIIGSLIKS